MADRVVLHIGTMKSGTTYLQGLLSGPVLRGSGAPAFYPGGTFGAQTKAVRGLLRPPEQRKLKAWRSLTRETREGEGVAVWSQEFLSFAPRGRAQEIVSSFDGAPVEVVITVRDQRRALPAQWQSFVRNRGTDTWADYLERIRRTTGGRSDRSKAVKSFRRAQDVSSIIDNWAGLEGVTGLVVVVVPPPSAPADLLWTRFCDAAGITVAAPPPDAAARANVSLGYASCDAMRRVNPQLESLGKRAFSTTRARLLEGLLALRDQEDRPRLDRAGAELAGRLNARIVAALDRPGVRLVGSTDELPLGADGSAWPDRVADPDPDHVRRALEAAWSTCVPGSPVPVADLEELATALGRELVARVR
ncbi:hypothetical protein [Nocardioides taihuensis]|uniref:Sulfotransferase family protein n=1 Tax=Nocardioides taihuensis TaxID=1835606 RepID=A0ABW0BMP6_9ACTN